MVSQCLPARPNYLAWWLPPNCSAWLYIRGTVDIRFPSEIDNLRITYP
jgi:hypothetical protein